MKETVRQKASRILFGPFGKKLSLAFFIVCPIVSFYLLELFIHNPFADIHFGLQLFSWLLYLLFYGVCFFLIGHLSGACALATFLVMAVGLLNYFVLAFRGSPILPWDIYSIGTAVSVADNQSFTLTPRARILCVCVLVLILLSRRCRLRLPFGGTRVVAAAAGVFSMAALILYLQTDNAKNTLGIYREAFTQGYAYNQNGFVVSYLMNTRYLTIDKPKGYNDEELADEITDVLSEDAIPVSGDSSGDGSGGSAADSAAKGETDGGENSLPNIIVIMNEAFSDLSVVNDFDTNKEYMPFFNSLTEDAVCGTAYVSIIGGNTSNSEFEFLTGDTMAFLPVGSTPYQQYIDSDLPSFVDILNEQGYHSIAMHPYYASGWDRKLVYDALGFDESYFIDDFAGAERLRTYVSDWGMYEKVIDLFENKENDEPLFLFGVTMQNHSGYSKDYSNFNVDVHVTSGDGDYHNADSYLSLIAQSDRAYERLIQYFSQTEEDTIIVMFGDHQPTNLETGFFNDVLGIDPSNLSLEETMLRYQTPFKIWANFDIEEKQDVELSVNYLGTYLMELAGLSTSEYQKFLSSMAEVMPAITANYIIDSDGNLYAYSVDSDGSDLPESCRSYLSLYQQLQYNHLFDDGNRQDSLFLIGGEDSLSDLRGESGE